MVGKTIAHYQILEKLGEGGMGVVYKARDTKLGRSVAVKVLPEQFAHDPQRMARFSREAHLLASLNHPHIASIHGIEEQDGVHALVMELVEGPTLADRIAQGPIPLEEALRLAQQMAEALEYAHEHGIVHRDLKPANVKVTEEGEVKLLDFGVAKAMEAEAVAGGDPASSPTLTLGATTAGVILGTAGYMSPEQAKGKSVDKRADIWAFGVVLYEMLTGRRLFEGETVSDTLAAVLKEEPKLDHVPGRVRRLLRRCLEKDPAKRLRDIGDAWELLEEISPAQAPHLRNWLPWAVAAALGVALALLGLLWLRAPAPEVLPTQFEVDPPGDTQFAYPYAATAVSPDGRYLVFAAGSAAGTPSLWLRPLDSLVSRPLQGTERGNLPFWSPDSKSIAFFANGKLKRSEVVGGATQVLCDVQILGGGTWSRDGVILFRSPEGLSRVPASGGVPQQVTQRNEARKESGHFMPQFLPDGNRFLYFIRSADSNTQGIYAGSLDRPGERLRLLAANHPAYYVPPRAGRPGFLLWLREQTLLAQGFDLARLRLEGDPTPLTEDILASSGGAAAAFWTSDAGLLVYRTGGVSVKAKLIWMGRDGKRLGEAGNEDRYGSFRISPDGRRLAMGRYDYGNNSDIWVFEFDRGVMTRLTFDPSQDGIPVWSPDGRQVAYFSARSGVRQIFRTDAGGGGKEEQLTNRPNGVLAAYDWSRDGRHLLYTEVDSKTGNDIWGLPLEGERKPIAVLQTSFSESSAQFSPDGKWVAYQSNESGRTDVYVRAFPVSSGQWQLSSEGGTRPRWRADGKELFFLGPGSDKIMAAGIRVEGANLQSDKPRELFSVSPLDTSLGSPYDVTADGQRFLVWQPSNAEQQGPAPLTVVTNWQARLKR